MQCDMWGSREGKVPSLSFCAWSVALDVCCALSVRLFRMLLCSEAWPSPSSRCFLMGRAPESQMWVRQAARKRRIRHDRSEFVKLPIYFGPKLRLSLT